MVESKRYWSK